MSILTTDLKKYGALNRPEDDSASSGGGVDTACILEVTQLASTTTVEALSSNAADTMNLTITGRNAAGEIVSETKALTGTTVRSFTTTFERVLKAVLASAAAGNVTIRVNTAGATVVVLPAGKTKAGILFINAASEAGSTVRYEKEFWKNEHATLTLTVATITLTADPSTSVRIGLEAAKNGSQSVANRKAAPSSVTFVDDSVAASIPGTQLEAASVIGVWVEMSRSAAQAAIKTSYTTQISGISI